jgi:FkbM family methyltransferase
MRREFRHDPAIKPVQLAVSNVCGRKQFFINRSSFTNSLLPSVDKLGLYENISTTEVAVTTIDDFCAREAVNEIHILKMDIQGGELMALEGARKKLSRQEISLIYTEILFAPMYEEQAQFFKICDFLSGYGYSLFDIYNLAYQASGQLAWGDAIFISPRIKGKGSPA